MKQGVLLPILAGFGVLGALVVSHAHPSIPTQPIAERTIEMQDKGGNPTVTYRVAKLGNGYFRIRAYAPGTEKLGTDNETAEFIFGLNGPESVWGDAKTVDQMRLDMQRFPKDLFT